MRKILSSQSEVGKLNSLFLAPISELWKSEENIQSSWKELNYTSAPDFSQAIKQYDKLREILNNENVEIFEFRPVVNDLSPDAIYCRDASVITDHGAILCNMGKTQRSREPQMHKKGLASIGMSILGTIKFPGTLEGGDVAWLDSKTLVVGMGYRTNLEGIRQISDILQKIDVQVLQVDLPHYKGPSDVFHIMSIFSPISHNKAVVFSPLMPVKFRNLLLEREIELIEVDESEYEKMGCNVLALSPKKCLMVAGCKNIHKSIEKSGIEVITYDGSEISIKGGGGPTCLTRPIFREFVS